MSTGMVWPMLPAWCWAGGLLWMERLLCYGVLCRLGLVLVRGSSVTEKGRKLSRSDQLSSDIDDEVESEEAEQGLDMHVSPYSYNSFLSEVYTAVNNKFMRKLS